MLLTNFCLIEKYLQDDGGVRFTSVFSKEYKLARAEKRDAYREKEIALRR